MGQGMIDMQITCTRGKWVDAYQFEWSWRYASALADKKIERTDRSLDSPNIKYNDSDISFF